MTEQKYKAGFLKAEKDCRDYEAKIQTLQKENEILKEACREISNDLIYSSPELAEKYGEYIDKLLEEQK